VTFPQFVREALERELGSSPRRPPPLTGAGTISTHGQALKRVYEPDAWR